MKMIITVIMNCENTKKNIERKKEKINITLQTMNKK